MLGGHIFAYFYCYGEKVFKEFLESLDIIRKEKEKCSVSVYLNSFDRYSLGSCFSVIRLKQWPAPVSVNQ